MLLCGFPTYIIGKMDLGKEPCSDTSLQHFAAHMLPVPVFMAIFLATLASVPWSHQVRNGEIADADEMRPTVSTPTTAMRATLKRH